MRRGEILGLTWSQVDFLNQRLTVGKSKTAAGQGRTIPLNGTALRSLQNWATNFPDRRPDHFVFASERYGLAGSDATSHVHGFDAGKPMRTLKAAWESAKKRSGVKCRFHDLRHSACTRFVERGVPLPVIASLLGWSAGTTVRMVKRYGHISADAQRRAVAVLAPDENANDNVAASRSMPNLHS
jgi:integrase